MSFTREDAVCEGAISKACRKVLLRGFPTTDTEHIGKGAALSSGPGTYEDHRGTTCMSNVWRSGNSHIELMPIHTRETDRVLPLASGLAIGKCESELAHTMVDVDGDITRLAWPGASQRSE